MSKEDEELDKFATGADGCLFLGGALLLFSLAAAVLSLAYRIAFK